VAVAAARPALSASASCAGCQTVLVASCPSVAPRVQVYAGASAQPRSGSALLSADERPSQLAPGRLAEHALHLEGCRSLVIVAASGCRGRRSFQPGVRAQVRRQPSSGHCVVRRVLPLSAAPSPVGSIVFRAPARAVRPDDDLCGEEGSRWRELSGARPGSLKPPATMASPAPPAPRRGLPRRESVGWRWREIAFACSMSETASACDLGRSSKPPPGRGNGGSPASSATDSGTVLGDDSARALSSAPSFGDATEGSAIWQPAPTGVAAAARSEERPDVGDVVVLGPGVQAEHRMRTGIVTKLADAHCTVVVLDPDRRVGIGECWPNFEDIAAIESRLLRAGTRVTLQKLNGARTRHLNGFSGVVSVHPKQGHPTFITKPSAPDHPQLTVCVKFDDPVAAGERSALLEPRFLLPYEDAMDDMTGHLSRALELLAQRQSVAGGSQRCANAQDDDESGEALVARALSA